MYKILRADSDAYITNKVVGGTAQTSANTGMANTLDLFKLYGVTLSGSTPNRELSRLLVHFDLDPIRDLISAGKISVDDSSFSCTLVLRDVYGGQPTPADFQVNVNPLASPFREGLGRDLAQFSDEDVCNWLSGTYTSVWSVAGCGSASVDYYTTDQVQQTFASGFEDLSVDVTAAVVKMIHGTYPDHGFRIAYDSSLENDTNSYFVKRFGARSVFDQNFSPALIVKFDDSVQDDTQIVTLDDDYTLFMYNYSKGQPANVRSGSTSITGSASVMLSFVTEISGGFYTLAFTGSQYTIAGNPVTGVYTASIHVPSSDPVVQQKMAQTGSFIVTPVWGSLDGTVGYLTGTKLSIPARDTTSLNKLAQPYTVTVTGLKPDVFNDELIHVRVNFFDPMNPMMVATKRQVITPGLVVRDAFYSIRDVDDGTVIVPFDISGRTTVLSSDKDGMWFTLDASSLLAGHRYIIDVKTNAYGQETVYQSASPAFRVTIH